MTHASAIHPPDRPPARLLLATDLGARCDRALDRTGQLASEWQAEVIALNVLDPSVCADQTLAWISGATDEQLMNVAQRQLVRDLTGMKMPVQVRIVRGQEPETAIRDVVSATSVDLVVTAVARQETFGRALLGSTNERLARSLGQPLLVVHGRTHGPYRRIVVATDFSEASRHALLTAVAFFPGRDLTLYHAYSPPMSGLNMTLSNAGIAPQIAHAECEAFIHGTRLPAGILMHPVVECGTITTTLAPYVRENDVDLVVLSGHGHTGIMSLLLGSTAERLLECLPCDTLLVPSHRSTV
ncbi:MULTISPECIES: universal stress protein [Rhodocyclales]|uniref:universal stress protein n=1 Tax=Rhodocyclales TaxID=206389 RepID=UPI0003722222|nr:MULTISPECIES: universal stress protein [Rhodocyclales]AKU12290.1 Usp-like protein [Azoarcus sp. CIB]